MCVTIRHQTGGVYWGIDAYRLIPAAGRGEIVNRIKTMDGRLRPEVVNGYEINFSAL